ncbi:PH and SEC7 domain-containing protein [Sporobolomyces salmoneus]|uniref:PH and SEC7 domain-containing protein n=1 Tax=Sporobolomyces salmoneus TaxID=183962 RepID=UPI0031716542
MSTPPQPAVVLSSPRSPSLHSTTTQRILHNSQSSTQLRPADTHSNHQSRSRSPSPGRSASQDRRLSESSSSGISALAAAGLGLLSLPPSPNPDQQSYELAEVDPEDEQEELAGPPRGRTNGKADSRKSSIGFIEPDKEKDPRDRSRTRKMSFGLGFEGRMRRLSFVGNSSASASHAGGSSAQVDESTGTSGSDSQSSAPRKSNKPKTLIRRARSFGTSPLLGGSANSSGTFPPPIPSSDLDDPNPPPTLSTASRPQTRVESSSSAHPSLSRLTTSSSSLASSSRSANSPNSSTPVTPLSAPVPYYPIPTQTRTPPPSLSRGSEERRNTEAPSQKESHWLLGPLVPTIETNGGITSGKGKQRESEARTGLGFEESGAEPTKNVGGKEKEKEKKKTTSALRRATLSVFGRRDTTPSVSSTPRPEEEPRRNSVDPPIPFTSQAMTESPTESPVQSRKNSSSAGLPSLPSLPSLQLSSNPYRMSWGFGTGSPTSSPAPSPARPRSSIVSSPTRSESPIPINIPTSSRPSLTISPVPSPRPSSSQPSPISANSASVSSLSPLRRETVDQLPVPPLLSHTLSTDSSKTLVVSVPPAVPPAAVSPSETSPHRIGRAHSASSPPLLRRTASYAPTTSPNPSSPLASPPLPLPSATEPSPLDRKRTLTRSARSHSDASDRRSPSLSTPPLSSSGTSFNYGGGRNSVTGGLGIPPGGGYFASAHYRTGTNSTSRRPGTADSPSIGRSSVFGFSGGWGSLFGGSGSPSTTSSSNNPNAASASMSRSSSSATSTPSTPGAGGIETNEFGALFDGSGGRGKATRPGTGRKRGLSVGNGFFGSSSASTASVTKEREMGRARSGSGSSVASDSPLKVPGVLGRMRASTDPNKRLSVGSSNFGGNTANTSNSSLALPQPAGGIGSRPATSEGVASLFGEGGNGNRQRGSSLSIVSPSQQSSNFSPTLTPGFRQEPKPVKKFPTPNLELGETPEDFVRRLMMGEGEDGEGKVGKGDVSRVLSASADPFYQQGLEAYLRCFPFESLPLDIALRLFLCSSSLPPETQQIDRVMEAFARRWCECNPELFLSKDHSSESTSATRDDLSGGQAKSSKSEVSDIPYVLAFSMVMLNTDAFNPNAKTKMSKADYVKNTRIDGVAAELLEYLYDQITLAPFVFVDEDNPASDFFDPSPTLSSSLSRQEPPALNATGTASGFFAGTNQKVKIDPYHFIATGQTSRFRVDVESHIPMKSPFSYTGTTSFLNATTLHSLFARAPILQTSNRPRGISRPQTAVPSNIAIHSSSDSLSGSPLVPTVSSSTFVATPAKDKSTVSNLKITKVGVLSRKEDLAEGGKKAASRKWKAWTVVLTGSQLLFFKDAHFAATLQHTLDTAAVSTPPRPDENHVLVFTLQTPFKPDAVLSLNNTVALYDASYRRHPNVFRLVAPAGRQYLFQAHDSDDLNSWLHAINYAASFKSASIRIRPLQAPTLRTSTNSSLPPSPSLSMPASPSFRSPANFNLVPAPSSLSLMSGSTSVSTNNMDARQDSTATVRPSNELDFESREVTGRLPGAVDGDPSLNNSTRPPQAEVETSTSKPLPELPPSTPIINSRADTLRLRINDLDDSIRRVKALVQEDLCLAKHLSILTPFRSTTREKVLTAIPPIEKRIRQTRMNLVKLICYREVLSRDLLVEDRETERLTRQRSLRRTTSQKARSPALSQVSMKNTTWSSPLAQSHSSLAIPFGGDGSLSETGRESFDSASESLRDDTRHAFTDDELDRLQTRSPPLMQRSRTEQDWNTAVEHLHSLPIPPSTLLDDELELPQPTEHEVFPIINRPAAVEATSFSHSRADSATLPVDSP